MLPAACSPVHRDALDADELRGRLVVRAGPRVFVQAQFDRLANAPHQHVHEELLIIKEGTLETFQSGTTRKVGPGGIIFQASNELHNVTNIGSTPATYYVIGWSVPGAPK